MADQLNLIRANAQEKLRKEAEVVVEVEKPSALQTAAVDYLSRKEEPHPLGSPKNLNEKVDVKEGKMSDLHMYIKQGKTAKEIGKLMGVDPKTIQKLMSAYDAKNESLELDEKEKSVRQLINPTKEVMVVKKNKVVVIDKKDQDKYMKQGWSLAEEEEVEEAKLIDKPTGEVLKTGSKEKMETEKKRNRDELQVKEWFKSKNIDVKVRELDESTQVYVPLGKRIPNEIREELIKTQYGKMPEDVKNVKDINYGNFMENSITMNNDFWTKVLHDTKGE